MKRLSTIIALVTLFAAGSVIAQTTRGAAPGATGTQVFTLDESFTRAYPSLQTDLGLNDDDFAVLRSMIFDVFAAKRALSGVPASMVNRSPALLQQAIDQLGLTPVSWRTLKLSPAHFAYPDLRDAVADPNTPLDVIKTKLDSFRAARIKALADLHMAMEVLQPLVTVRQEAVLVTYGFLD